MQDQQLVSAHTGIDPSQWWQSRPLSHPFDSLTKLMLFHSLLQRYS